MVTGSLFGETLFTGFLDGGETERKGWWADWEVGRVGGRKADFKVVQRHCSAWYAPGALPKSARCLSQLRIHSPAPALFAQILKMKRMAGHLPAYPPACLYCYADSLHFGPLGALRYRQKAPNSSSSPLL